MTVQAMGYFWVGTSKLDDWTSFATANLGFKRLIAAVPCAPSAWTTESNA
jgi:hypothetical protein